MIPPRRVRYSRIGRLAEDLAAAVDVPPVPVETMVREHGIELRTGDLGGEVSGLLMRTGTDAVIGVNSSQHRLRRRFTIAHEFGHYLLHEEIREHVDRGYAVRFRSARSSQAVDVEEMEANFFAASLLMPRRLLDAREAASALDSDEAVKRLAAAFDVSRHAMSLRLANVYREYAPY